MIFKDLINRFTNGENNIPQIIQYSLQIMSASEQRNTLGWLGYNKVKESDISLSEIEDEEKLELEDFSIEVQNFINL